MRDVGTYRAFVDVALRDAIAAGQVEGPRMFVAGAYVTVTGGGGEVTGLPADVIVPDDMRRGVANNEAEVRQRVRELLAGGADFIKVIATGAVLTSGTMPGAAGDTPRAEIRAAVEEAAQATARSSPRTRTAPRASSARCAPACARSSTAPISTTKASR